MNVEVKRSFLGHEWIEVCNWLIANYERVRAHDAGTWKVRLDRLRVWSQWDETVSADFMIDGDDDLVLWFRMKYL